MFENKPVFGMIHLSGNNPVQRAMEEIQIYIDQGVDAAIIENYHGSVADVEKILHYAKGLAEQINIGINILPNDFRKAFGLASRYGASFIQLDYVAGEYEGCQTDYAEYNKWREEYSHIKVLGGVWPKYYTPQQGSNLEADIRDAEQRADAIVVTGYGTGMQTPIDKIQKFRDCAKGPVIVGAGLNCSNAYSQLSIADGAIIGSAFKPNGNTQCEVVPSLVKDLMDIVREVR